MAKGFKVAPVEGRTIVDPFNTRHSSARTNAPQRRIGFTRKVDAENSVVDPRSGKSVPAETWEPHGDEEIVLETSDGFYRTAFRTGDLDYLGSVDVGADGTTKPLPLERDLLAMTAVNKALRERRTALEKAAAKKAADANDADAKAHAEKAVEDALAAADQAEKAADVAKDAAEKAAKPAPAIAPANDDTTPPNAA